MDLVGLLGWANREFGVSREELFAHSRQVCAAKGAEHLADELCDDAKDEFVRKWPDISRRARGDKNTFLWCFRQRVDSRRIDFIRSPRSRTQSLDRAAVIGTIAREVALTPDQIEARLREIFGKHPDCEQLVASTVLAHVEGLPPAECVSRMKTTQSEYRQWLAEAERLLLKWFRGGGKL